MACEAHPGYPCCSSRSRSSASSYGHGVLCSGLPRSSCRCQTCGNLARLDVDPPPGRQPGAAALRGGHGIFPEARKRISSRGDGRLKLGFDLVHASFLCPVFRFIVSRFWFESCARRLLVRGGTARTTGGPTVPLVAAGYCAGDVAGETMTTASSHATHEIAILRAG